jgi:four helix bundle protein
MVRCFRDLLVWQKAMALVEETYRLTRELPRSEEFGLKSQMRRAAVSIPSNIAEGQSRNRPREFKHFLQIAKGSLSELETQFDLVRRLGFLPDSRVEQCDQLCREVGKMLNGLTISLDFQGREG